MRIAFDDGPLETTEAILDILATHGVKATFFVVGERVEGNEELLLRMLRDGHEIGNHTWSHPRLTEISDAEIDRELERCDVAVQRAAGVSPTHFRPPFAAVDDGVLEVARDRGLQVAAVSSVGDYDLDADRIVAAALSAAADGFVGLHDGHWPTVEALPRILEGLAT